MWNVIGHAETVSSLQAALDAQHLSRALLFTGPSGIGKTHLAIEVARVLNCTGENPPCGDCLHCRQIEQGIHPDVVVIERAEGKTAISIEQVRELRDAAALRPFQGQVKVFIIAGAETLTDGAADALLKTLEEPQPQVAIILTAGDPDALPATVLSRVAQTPLRPVPTALLERALIERGHEALSAARLARTAQGNVGWALRAAENPKLLIEQEAIVARLAGILDMSLRERLDLAESLASDRKDRPALRRNLELLLLVGRDLLLLTQGRPVRFVSPELQPVLEAQTRRLSLSGLHAFLSALRLAMQRIDRNVDPRLALEAMLLGLP